MGEASHKRLPWQILPSLGWVLFFLVIPLGIVFLFSILHKGHYGQIEYTLDFQNYARIFEPVYLKIVGRSFLLAFNTALICLILSYPLAYYMARCSKRVKLVLLGMVIVPFWTNCVIRIYALKLVLGENGVLNQILMSLHLISSPLQMTENHFGVMAGMVYNYLPFMILPLYVSLEKLDFTLLDAAYDLGANWVQTVTKVLFPLSLPGVITGSLFVFPCAFGEFVIPDLMGGGRTMYVGTLISETFLKLRDWPFGSVMSMFLVTFAMLTFAFLSTRSSKEQGGKVYG